MAPTCHMVTSFIFLHPEFTLRTLLVFGTLDELYEFLIVLIEYSADTVFFTGLALVELYFALKAIHFMAVWTVKLGISFLERKDVLAASRRAP